MRYGEPNEIHYLPSPPIECPPSGGTFTITMMGHTTAPIVYRAAPQVVAKAAERALDALPPGAV